MAQGLPPGAQFFELTKFGGLNTQGTRSSIGDEEFSWLENLIPIGAGNLRSVYGPATPVFQTCGPVIQVAVFTETQGASWTGTIITKFSVIWPSPQDAVTYFQSGGNIAISLAQPGGTAVDVEWNQMYANMGQLFLTADATSINGSGAGGTVNTTTGFNQLGALQTLYTGTGATTFDVDSYTIDAVQVTNGVQFTLTFTDIGSGSYAYQNTVDAGLLLSVNVGFNTCNAVAPLFVLDEAFQPFVPVPPATCTYQTPGTMLVADPLTSQIILPLELYAPTTPIPHSWYNADAFAGTANNVVVTPTGLLPKQIGFLYGGPYIAQTFGTISIGGILQNNAPPQYGMIGLPADTPFGCSIEFHTVTGLSAGLSVAVYAPSSTAHTGGLPIAGGNLNMAATATFATGLGFQFALLAPGQFYTMEFQMTIDGTGNPHTCYYLKRSTDGFYLAETNSWVSTPTSIMFDLFAQTDVRAVHHLLSPLPGMGSDIPTSAILLNVAGGFNLPPPPPTSLTLQNLKVYLL